MNVIWGFTICPKTVFSCEWAALMSCRAKEKHVREEKTCQFKKIQKASISLSQAATQRRQHCSDRMHHCGGRSGLQDGGGESGVMVRGRQPHPQHGQDEGGDGGHEGGEETSSATVYPGAGAGEQL